MRGTLESTLPWWAAGPVLGLVGVRLQPRLAGAAEQVKQAGEGPLAAVTGADVL